MPLPIENLDDKTFEELVKEAVSRIPVYAPEWTDHNIHDPGITLIELFAWLAEMQIYRLNRISDESYRKFLTLGGIHDHTEAASGGEETEKLEEAIIRARKDMKTVYRAVTSADYEHLAMNVPELFNWDDVPGNDSVRLIRFLKDDLGIEWAEKAEIGKPDDKTIYISESPHDGKSAKIVIDEEEGNATLTTSNGITHDLKVKKENGKLNIYFEVARAKAIPRYHPSQDSEVPGIVTVVVVPESENPRTELEPGTSILKTVYRHLDEHRLLTTELFVMSPEYVEVSVKATVVIKPKNEPGRVKNDIEKKLRYFLDPITGGVDEKGWPFGRSVYKSEIYEIIDGVDGVDYVTSLLLKQEGEDQPGDIQIPPHSLVLHSTEFPTIITTEKGASHG